jgi:hypothetical protein
LQGVEARKAKAYRELEKRKNEIRAFDNKASLARQEYEQASLELQRLKDEIEEVVRNIENLKEELRQKVLQETQDKRDRIIRVAEETAEAKSNKLIYGAFGFVIMAAFALFLFVLASMGVKKLSDSLGSAEKAPAFTTLAETRMPALENRGSMRGLKEQVSRPALDASPVIPEDRVSGHLECPRKECEGTMRLENVAGTLKYVCSNSPACKMKIEYPFKCYRCGAEMVLRDGKNGKFWGCSTFPKCRHTNDYK